ncbi:holo-acyl-carrier-protein synthase [Candidatus Arthromitus sp. SFB-mouse-Japan]|uniref:holo-ACP synthase n=1 Tax=unclassified Candidatus Neoarthromitus TaxID=2638829 RepID=UPI00021B8037|nr:MULTISPECIES: holo-ACP synthase [unclassified Candidatus Arthromitus]EIA27812.1 Holo-[acyl-carrier-protein] synthase [Candidatus Arthromitus sp. SFB-4]AID44007.1 Holo-acyl-carrier protein synthase [Candidatus Arthromitus sp. SFB-mouse-NL]EGX27898.1 holo-[acyl-carrier-protein] synthase [Candidatus Arthromitus sp. SFB-mouse-NYU]BAK55843.1 holo-acyl-carrier-protein synthase [Candidatus Arthromitus sp. SFB-mouse-Japan]BAK79203.1 holo-[acyl-carrier-protein] synthase [Candidatus Arthromitus sp. S
MIVGSGCDILSIRRVESLLRYNKFLDKYFTGNEICMFNNQKNKKNYVKKIASNLCVKEAFFKSISHKFKKFSFKDIEVLRDKDGRPYLRLLNSLKEFINININVTISNERDYVISFIILEI